MKLLLTVLLSAILLTTISTGSSLKGSIVKRSLQQVQADTGVHTNTGVSASVSSDGAFSMMIFGQVMTFSWDRWIWGIVMILVGIPLCFLTISWWKFMRLPIGAIVGFFALNAIELYIVMPYVSSGYNTGVRIGWIIGYVIFAVLGVILFWKCPKFSVGMTTAWLAWMFGLQVNGWIALGVSHNLNNWLALSIAIAFATGGFFLGCYFPNFSIIGGTAGAGCTLFMIGLGILSLQYPGVQYGQAAYVWWMYFVAQIMMGVAGFFFQFCWGYKKHGHSVTHEGAHLHVQRGNVGRDIELGGNAHVEIEVQI